MISIVKIEWWQTMRSEFEKRPSKCASTSQIDSQSSKRKSDQHYKMTLRRRAPAHPMWLAGFATSLLAIAALAEAEWGPTADSASPRRCSFPAVFNFGDSNSDTDTVGFSLPSGKLFRWASNGRLVIDFMAEELGLPYLTPYRHSLGANSSYGANFAAGGASCRPGKGFSQYNLGLQVSQFIRFKSLHSNSTIRLPTKEDFTKALYTVDIGQNDLAYGFQYTPHKVLETIPNILHHFYKGIKKLHKEGARAFWIHNTGPAGCLPQQVQFYKSNPRELDQHGCANPENHAAQEFNRQLKLKVNKLRKKYLDATFVYVDMYSAKYHLISNAENMGFDDPMKVCCGNKPLDCKREVINETIIENGCDDPERHISWDGLHYTEAANSWIARHIFSGSYSDSHVALKTACFSTIYS